VRSGVLRFGSVVELNQAKESHYRALHAEVWPSVLDRLRASHVRNYSIYITEIDGRKYLFSYFEYTGADWEADQRAIAADPETQRWWEETDPCQIQLPSRKSGDQWTVMERLFLME